MKFIKNLYEYLEENLTEGTIDFSIRVSRSECNNLDGTKALEFYIHPSNKSGETGDFTVHKEGVVGVKPSFVWDQKN